jgi:Ca-activated chloride channel family protein
MANEMATFTQDKINVVTRMRMLGAWRALGRLVLESVLAGLFVSLVLALAVFVASTPASAATAAPADQGGALLLRAPDGSANTAPLLFTDVAIKVNGIVARVTVAQRFANPTPDWREGVYTFPLPEGAAIDHLHLRVGDRIIVGEIREREEARKTYEAAKTDGRKATLLTQQRPNMFTTKVANIGPGEEVVVTLEYQQTLQFDSGSLRLRFPLAITPRYSPAATSGDAVSAEDTVMAASSAPQDATESIETPTVDPATGYVNPVNLSIDLNAGFALTRVASSYHDVTIEEQPGHRYRIALARGPVPAARDFELVWTPEAGAAPSVALFTETRGAQTYALLLALPPATPAANTSHGPREITYIVDTSGSMDGVSIMQARDALLMALDRLQDGDRFNVIEFNSRTFPLFAAPVAADAQSLRKAKAFVAGLKARDGTEMLPALKAALVGPRASQLMRQVVFLTDGAVDNEDALLRLIHDDLGDRRLFTVGIGPAPNTFFLTRAAQFGRGTFTFIGDVREVKEKMDALLRKIESPAVTDIRVSWPAGAASWPNPVPDLYPGEPIVLTAAWNRDSTAERIDITGNRGGAPWAMQLPTSANANEPGIGVLWARAKIAALMDAKRQGAPEPEIRKEVIAVALDHHLMSQYTSMVAVDQTPTRPAGVSSLTSKLPGNLPEGLSADAFATSLPATATSAPRELVFGALALLLAALFWIFRRYIQRQTAQPGV